MDIIVQIVFKEEHHQFLKDAIDTDPEMVGVEGTYPEKAVKKVKVLVNAYLKERKDDIEVQALNSKFQQDREVVRDTDLPEDIISVT